MTAEMDVYGGEVSSPKDLSNGHVSNVGGSYVFVNGHDDPLDSDLTTEQSNTNPNLDVFDPSSHLKEKEKEELLTHTDPGQDLENQQPHYSDNAHHQGPSCPLEAVSPTHQIDTQQPLHTHEADVSCSADHDSKNVDVQTTQTAPVSILDTPTAHGFTASEDAVERETETGILAVADSHPADNEEFDNDPVRNDSESCFPCNGAGSETQTALDSVDLEGQASASISCDSTLKSIVPDEVTDSIDGQPISVGHAGLESGSIGKENSLPTCPPAGADVKMGPELENKSVVSSAVIPGDDGAVLESDIINGSVFSSESAQNCVPDVIHEGIPYGESDGEIQLTAGGSDGKTQESGEIEFTGGESVTCQEVEEKVLQESEVQLTDGEDKTCQDGEIQNNDDQTGQEGKENGEISGDGNDDQTGQEKEENGEISGEGNDDQTGQEEEENGEISGEGNDDQTGQEEEENREIQFTGVEKVDEIAKREENREIQFTGVEKEGEIAEREEKRGDEIAERWENRGDEIAEREENRGDEIAENEENRGYEIVESEENRGVEFPEGEENGEVEFPEGKENMEGKFQEGEENMEGEIQFTSETCQKIEDSGETQFDDGERDDKESQFIGGEGGGKAFQEVEGIDGIRRNETPSTTPEGSTLDASEMQNSGTESEMQNASSEVVKRPFYYLIKVPRYDDENLREQIKCAQLIVDEKTKSRDVIRAEIQTLRDAYKKYGDNLEAAMSEEKAARELLKSKRQEIDSLQSMINKVKNAISIEDIDGRIRNMEHMIAHETLPLKEEKQFIREIKQLKQLREQFSSSMGKQDEVQQAFDQKDQIEERLKLLRKEADSLRENVLKAEAVTQAARKKQKDESEKLRKLYTQFRVADDVRQEAYKHLQSLRKQAYDKNKYFWKYKDDVKQANDLVSKGDKEALQHLCASQVERVLELWNNNNEFREQYVSCNIRSTLRRLKTLDGRSLGPDEVPPVIPTVSYNRVAKDNYVTQISALKEEKTEQVVLVKSEIVDDKPIPTVGERKNQTAKSKRPAKVAYSATVSGRDKIEEARDEVPKRTKEEEELARKAEEMRKKEEAAKLKEQLRLEEKIKAKEALERKKRIAEKAQARAALRAQKEAEEKEKEREKRARKKEKRKAAEAGDTALVNEGESAPSMETTEEIPESSDVREKSMTGTKRPQKSSQFTKQTKVKSIPLPLRNRGKRRMQTWMWVLLTVLVVVALFLLGNSSFAVNFGLQGFGF